ncbi:small integral membrane protein 12 [Chelonus insularis]|uniref:small integral membrane protein 12 n=1 Tax=Chelonus insularis TaxID=460826 RepID=UPI001588D70C|nr:small integral membrane protein 12 [Chelonus insularis]XP_034939484.1 small integral membrane protein 12 [Chelonus insularis]
MWPILMSTLRRYVPYVTLPFAGIIGIIGSYLEGCVSDRHTPSTAPIVQQREERFLENLDSNSHNISKHKPFEVNISPSLS